MEPQPHARHSFAADIERIEHDVVEMGSKSATMLAQAVEALSHLNVDLAKAVMASDDEVDQLDLMIEDRCIRMLGLQHPMATDLRVISTSMKLITDLERIGDLSVDIAKIALKIAKEFGNTDSVDIPAIAHVARKMVLDAIEAFIRRDLEIVQRVITMDDEVDAMYRDLREQIFISMKTDPANVVGDTWLLLAVHHVERIADHAVNIAERVAFMVTGDFKQLSSKHTLEKLQ